METRSPAVRYDGSLGRLQALIEASRALAAAAGSANLLRRILDLATHHVGADRGALFVETPDGSALVASLFHGNELQEIRVERGRGLVGDVVATGRPIRIEDAYADARFDRTVDARTGYKTRSVLVVPLVGWEGHVLGALQVLNRQDGLAFDEDDEGFLAAFAAQAAVALETARLHEAHVREERLAAVGQVVATLVHDLRGPLSGLVGYTGLLEQDPPQDVRLHCAAALRRQGSRMDQMVRSILRYVRGEERYLFAKTDIDGLLDEAAADHGAALHDTQVEVVREGERVGAARVDALALRRAIDNLVRNASEALRGRGRIGVGARREGDAILLEVSDDGPGLPTALRGRLFEAYATSGKAEGTGLGLESARRVAEGHGGKAFVVERSGPGTTIALRLPIAGPPEGDAKPVKP